PSASVGATTITDRQLQTSPTMLLDKAASTLTVARQSSGADIAQPASVQHSAECSASTRMQSG
ncbi:MAG: hypothetical protein ACRD6W_07605, partial [Nitrososphaerales archaeon]